MSEPQMPQCATRTSSWSGPGAWTGRSSTVITPGDWYTAAGITVGRGGAEAFSDTRVRLGALLEPSEPSGQVAQVGRGLPGAGEVAQRGVERAAPLLGVTP